MKKSSLIISSIIMATAITVTSIGNVYAHISESDASPKHHVKNCHGQGHKHNRLMHRLKELHLSEQQRDRIFAIRHQLAPEMRAKKKELHEIRYQLRQAAMSHHYDATKVRELAKTQANIHAEMTVLRTEAKHKIYEVLTPEQQRKLTTRHS